MQPLRGEDFGRVPGRTTHLKGFDLFRERDVANNGLPFDLGALDLDGTVLRRDLTITDRTLNVLRRLRELGMRLVVATGRHYEGAREHAERLGFGGDDPVICYGGSMVRRMNGETLLFRTLPVDLSVEVLNWAAQRNLHARVFLDGEIVTSPNNTAVRKHLRRADEPNVTAVDSPAAYLEESGREPIKLVIVDYPDAVASWLDAAREAFAGRLFVTRSLPHYVEVSGLEGTKSSALEFLCGRWGIDPARTVAFGDADNDVDMLRFAGLGVAVGGMSEEVRAAADAVTRPVDEDGVALYLEKMIEESTCQNCPR